MHDLLCLRAGTSRRASQNCPYTLPFGSDYSHTLSERHCGPPGYVIWTRKSVDAIALLSHADTIPGPNVPRVIVGTVFDSVGSEPLRGAHVHLADLARETVTDSLGAFRFDSLTPGEHAIWADHPRLDTLGLFSLGVRVDATARAVNTTALTVPSFATLWHVACGAAAPPRKEFGFIYGRVLAQALAPVTVTGEATIKSPLKLTGFYDRWMMRQKGTLSGDPH